MVTVERKWPGSTFVILASGPSLCLEDVELCRGKTRVIAINDAVRLAPWADVLYGGDGQWWRRQYGVACANQSTNAVRSFKGLQYALVTRTKECPGVQVLREVDQAGIDRDPCNLRTGHIRGLRSKHSGFQAINLAVHLGAKRILLLGYDLQRGKHGKHFFPAESPDLSSPYRDFLRAYPSVLQPLNELGIEIRNCSRTTALTCIPRMALSDALDLAVAA
jgi:hypothetical protein